MCVLSDVDIMREVESGHLIIEPFDKMMLKPNGLDWVLSPKIKVADRFRGPEHFNNWFPFEGEELDPNDFYLGRTVERLVLPNNIMAMMTGRSSVGRLGVLIHITAAHFDAGFRGTGVSEMKVVGPWPIPLTGEDGIIGKPVGQFIFEYTRTPASVGYNDLPTSHYKDQADEPIPSRLYN